MIIDTPAVPGGRTCFSRRRAIGAMLGACGCLRGGTPAAVETGPPIRLAISESVVGDVNLNDARAAMMVWIKQMVQELNVVVEQKLFSTTQEIVDRARRGQLDAIALNVIEYRPIADLLDSSQIVTAAGAGGVEQYLILAKQNGGIRRLGDLKGRRMCILKTPKMCVAPVWLSTLLDNGHYGTAEQFFNSIVSDTKFSRVVLPVFFGQADACLTSKRGFEMMCELNPQVGKDLVVLASSPALVVNFYVFRKNYHNLQRDRLIKAISGLRNSASGQQLATLFQFEELVSRDGASLASALTILDTADPSRSVPLGGGRK